MSMHLHLRAVAPSQIQDDHAWLAAFMAEAWTNRAAERAAGVAASIDKIWNTVNDLYAAAGSPEGGTGRPWTLPIYGGRPVTHGGDADPPLMILDPPGVTQAAEFLAGVSFDALWTAARARLVGLGWDESDTREELLGHHGSLRRLYGRAAVAGHAVVKAVWA